MYRPVGSKRAHVKDLSVCQRLLLALIVVSIRVYVFGFFLVAVCVLHQLRTPLLATLVMNVYLTTRQKQQDNLPAHAQSQESSA